MWDRSLKWSLKKCHQPLIYHLTDLYSHEYRNILQSKSFTTLRQAFSQSNWHKDVTFERRKNVFFYKKKTDDKKIDEAKK